MGEGVGLLFRNPHRTENTGGPRPSVSEFRMGRADFMRGMKGAVHDGSVLTFVFPF